MIRLVGRVVGHAGMLGSRPATTTPAGCRASARIRVITAPSSHTSILTHAACAGAQATGVAMRRICAAESVAHGNHGRSDRFDRPRSGRLSWRRFSPARPSWRVPPSSRAAVTTPWATTSASATKTRAAPPTVSWPTCRATRAGSGRSWWPATPAPTMQRSARWCWYPGRSHYWRRSGCPGINASGPAT